MVIKRIDRQVQWFRACHEETHALATTREQNALRVATSQQATTCLVEIILIGDTDAGSPFGLRLIGCQRGHTLEAKQLLMRVNHNYFPQLTCQGQTTLNDSWTDHAIFIVGEHHRV